MEFGPKSFLESDKYVVQPNDRLLVIVQGTASYSFQTFVTLDGKIPLFRINLAAPTLNVQNLMSPLSGSEKMLDVEGIINAKGKTLSDVKGIIKNFYTKIYGDVDIELSLIESGKTYIYVEGEVNSPGAFSYYPGMSVNDYIGLAGGFTQKANERVVYIIRNGKVIKNVEGAKLLIGDRIVVPRNKVKEYLPIIHTGIAVIYSATLIIWYALNIWRNR